MENQFSYGSLSSGHVANYGGIGRAHPHAIFLTTWLRLSVHTGCIGLRQYLASFFAVFCIISGSFDVDGRIMQDKL